jgi:hypothetical protein
MRDIKARNLRSRDSTLYEQPGLASDSSIPNHIEPPLGTIFRRGNDVAH